MFYLNKVLFSLKDKYSAYLPILLVKFFSFSLLSVVLFFKNIGDSGIQNKRIVQINEISEK